MKRTSSVLVVLLALALTPASVFAGPISIDDFEDGTTEGWFVPDPGHPNPPTNIAVGGPGGALDNYLRLTAVGLGPIDPGSRLSMLNESQWTGHYAGLSAISMDVNNFGPTDLYLRFLVVNFPVVGPPTDVAWTLAPVIVPAGSGWTRVSFNMSPGSFFAPFGSVAGALSDVDELRLFHSVAPFFGGPNVGSEPVVAVLGVDNITAVPEPSTLLLLGSGVVALALARRKRIGRTRS